MYTGKTEKVIEFLIEILFHQSNACVQPQRVCTQSQNFTNAISLYLLAVLNFEDVALFLFKIAGLASGGSDIGMAIRSRMQILATKSIDIPDSMIE